MALGITSDDQPNIKPPESQMNNISLNIFINNPEIIRTRSELDRRRDVLVNLARDPDVQMDALDRESIITQCPTK